MDKYAGAIAGLHLSPNDDAGMSFEQVALASNVEELLMVQEPILTELPSTTTSNQQSSSSTTTTASGETKTVLLQAQIDPNTGEIMWLPTSLSLEESHNQTIAKSQMSGMLRDTYRNTQYKIAITKCIQNFMSTFKNKAPTVLDIGSGTGLLSILAAQAGAKHVYGIEQFTPLASLSEKVVSKNNLPPSNRVTILNSHSAEVNIGIRSTNASTNIPMKTDLVISEIVDSALLGEGIIPALKDAYSRLVDLSLTNTAGILPCVPVKAKVYGQLIYAEPISLWQDSQRTIIRENIPNSADSSVSSPTSTSFTMGRKDWEPVCLAQPITLPVHIRSLLNHQQCKVASEPFIAAEIDFTPKGLNINKKPGSKLAPSTVTVPNGGSYATCIKQTVSDNGITERILLVSASTPETMIGKVESTKGKCSTMANAVLYWWDLILWEDNKQSSSSSSASANASVSNESTIVYSTVPVENYSTGKDSSWQDHWVQCIQPLPTTVSFDSSSSSASKPQFTVVTEYNDTHFSFYVAPGEAEVWSSKQTRAQTIQKNPTLASNTGKQLLFTEPEICVCGLHTLYTYERRWMLADNNRTHTLRTVIDKTIQDIAIEKINDMKSLLKDADIDDDEDGGVRDIRIRILDASDGSFCGLLAATSPQLPEGCTTYVFSLEKGDASVVHAQALATNAQIADRFAVLADYACYEVTSDVLAMAEATVSGVNAEITDEADIIDLTVENNNGSEESKKEQQDETEGIHSNVIENVDEESKENNGDNQPVEDDEEEPVMDDQLVYVSATSGVTIDILVAEPWYQQMSTVPLWMVPAFWYRRTALQSTLSSNVRIIPAGATVYGQLVQFTHLHNGHGPIGHKGAAGVDILHEPYDHIVKDYTKYTYSFPLWQYEYTLIDKPIVLSRIDFTKPAPLPNQPWPNTPSSLSVVDITSTTTDTQLIKDYYSTKVSSHNVTYRVGSEHRIENIHHANGILYYIDFHLSSLPDTEQILSTGPLPNNQPTYWRQMVRFLSPETMTKQSMNLGLYLNEEKGIFEFLSE